MDLALHLGCTVAELEARMSPAEWDQWRLLHAWRGLPFRRLELHLARIAQTVMASVGAFRDRPVAPLTDFTVDPTPMDEWRAMIEAQDDVDTLADEADAEPFDAFDDEPILGTFADEGDD